MNFPLSANNTYTARRLPKQVSEILCQGRSGTTKAQCQSQLAASSALVGFAALPGRYLFTIHRPNSPANFTCDCHSRSVVCSSGSKSPSARHTPLILKALLPSSTEATSLHNHLPTPHPQLQRSSIDPVPITTTIPIDHPNQPSSSPPPSPWPRKSRT